MTNLRSPCHAWSLGLALGITWGVGIFLVGIFAWLFGWGLAFVSVLSSIYIGYSATFLGSVIGGLWGFIDLFIAGVIIAWLYNLFASKHHSI